MTWKPVANTIDVDLALGAVGGDDAVGVIRAMRSVITSVFGFGDAADSRWSELRIRLQPAR